MNTLQATIHRPPDINVEVELQLSDVLRASYRIFARRARYLIVAYGVLLVSVLGLMLFSGAEASRGPAVLQTLATVLIFLPLFPFGFIYWNSKRQFYRAGRDRKLRYRLNPSGLDIYSEGDGGWLPWFAIEEAVETKSSFLLFLSAGEHYLIPKRCFRDRTEVDSIRALLRQQVGDKDKL